MTFDIDSYKKQHNSLSCGHADTRISRHNFLIKISAAHRSHLSVKWNCMILSPHKTTTTDAETHTISETTKFLVQIYLVHLAWCTRLI